LQTSAFFAPERKPIMNISPESAGEQGPGREILSRSPRLFRNPVLDKLSRVHHLAPLFVYVPIVGGLLYLTVMSMPIAAATAALFAGYVVWTLVEYLGHRFLFHYRARTPLGRRVGFLIHGVHHDHPNDPLRLVMPPLMSLPIMATAWLIFRIVFGAGYLFPVLAGFMTGYLVYDMLHFHVHHGHPRTAVGRMLRFRHMHHHFRDEASWFGVSAPWWDHLFGTRPARSRL
jgi:sterol desaturase/sphingolipid hydroxylase (fatty acid hydroxylase superfamily)